MPAFRPHRLHRSQSSAILLGFLRRCQKEAEACHRPLFSAFYLYVDGRTINLQLQVISHPMFLPKDLQHFSVPTLIVVANHVSASFYLVGGDAAEEVSSVGEPKIWKSDKELNTEPSAEDGERVRRLVGDIGEMIERFIRSGQAERFHLVMQADLAHAVQERLDMPTAAVLVSSLPLDVGRESIIDIIRRLVKLHF